jgi:serine/threonine protein phosphatase 1
MVGGDGMRDIELEMKIQRSLNEGNNVWVVGDVHGFNQTLRSLVAKLDIKTGDYVVLLGDLIDRGPDSYDVIQFVKNSPNMATVKGNHEKMMAKVFSLSRLEKPDLRISTWFYNGGLSTATSYINAYTDSSGNENTQELHQAIERDKLWIEQLPSQIVLDDWRLVHAGYDPNVDLDCQTDSELLHVRKPFHRATEPIDIHRTILFGHSITITLPGLSKENWGDVWYSSVKLDDGRPAAIGLDTCVFHTADSPAMLTAYNLQDGRVVQQTRVEPWNKRAIKQANNV